MSKTLLVNPFAHGAKHNPSKMTHSAESDCEDDVKTYTYELQDIHDCMQESLAGSKVLHMHVSLIVAASRNHPLLNSVAELIVEP